MTIFYKHIGKKLQRRGTQGMDLQTYYEKIEQNSDNKIQDQMNIFRIHLMKKGLTEAEIQDRLEAV